MISSFVCVFITAGPITKLFAWGEDSGGHVCVFITAGPSTHSFPKISDQDKLQW